MWPFSKNADKKSSTEQPVPESKTKLLPILGGRTVLTSQSPYRTPETKPMIASKNKIKKPYKLPAFGYALIAFMACVMAGVVGDAVSSLIPQATATPCASAMAFMFLAFFCGSQAVQKWKH